MRAIFSYHKNRGGDSRGACSGRAFRSEMLNRAADSVVEYYSCIDISGKNVGAQKSVVENQTAPATPFILPVGVSLGRF